jgi:PleD family two-component response regulator
VSGIKRKACHFPAGDIKYTYSGFQLSLLQAAMKRITPDLILQDIKMPEMDGFEALACLKSNSSYSDIHVIFLTGDTDAAIEARGLELGVLDRD